MQVSVYIFNFPKLCVSLYKAFASWTFFAFMNKRKSLSFTYACLRVSWMINFIAELPGMVLRQKGVMGYYSFPVIKILYLTQNMQSVHLGKNP